MRNDPTRRNLMGETHRVASLNLSAAGYGALQQVASKANMSLAAVTSLIMLKALFGPGEEMAQLDKMFSWFDGEECRMLRGAYGVAYAITKDPSRPKDEIGLANIVMAYAELRSQSRGLCLSEMTDVDREAFRFVFGVMEDKINPYHGSITSDGIRQFDWRSTHIEPSSLVIVYLRARSQTVPLTAYEMSIVEKYKDIDAPFPASLND